MTSVPWCNQLGRRSFHGTEPFAWNSVPYTLLWCLVDIRAGLKTSLQHREHFVITEYYTKLNYSKCCKHVTYVREVLSHIRRLFNKRYINLRFTLLLDLWLTLNFANILNSEWHSYEFQALYVFCYVYQTFRNPTEELTMLPNSPNWLRADPIHRPHPIDAYVLVQLVSLWRVLHGHNDRFFLVDITYIRVIRLRLFIMCVNSLSVFKNIIYVKHYLWLYSTCACGIQLT